MNNIQILIAAHQDVYVPKNQLLRPFQVGTALAENKLPDILHDDQGVHISEKNKTYCELTAQYWAWKNLEADYYGFFHYRRYLDFSGKYEPDRRHLTGPRMSPYKEEGSIRTDLSKFGLHEKQMRKIIEAYDVITVLGEWMNVTVYEQYCQFHQQEDLDCAIRILKETYPQFAKACDWYMNSKYIYFCNMYIMKREYFFAYMEWLFPILEQFEQEKDFSECSEREMRATGFLAERLFGVYYTQLKRMGKASCCELGYIIFHDTQPERVMKPYFGTDSVNLVTAANHAFVPYLSVMLASVIKYADSRTNYDIVVMHTDVSMEYQKMTEKMADGRKNICIRFLDVSERVKGIKLHVHDHLTPETYFRYFMLDLMPEYAKALWLDADLVVLTDVGELYHKDLHRHCISAVRDLDMIGTYRTDPHVKKYADKMLKLKHPYDYFQAGVMLLNLKKIREKYTSEDFIRITTQYRWRMMDQDVLNKMLQGEYLVLDQKWNVMMDWQENGKKRSDILKHAPYRLWKEYEQAREAPAVIHYAGGWKPWKVPDCDFASCFWSFARRSPFYEIILYNCIPQARFRCRTKDNPMRVFRLRPTNFRITIDMQKVNQLLPAGSLRRRLVRTVCGKFL